MPTVLTIHKGGAHPDELARLEQEAARAMNALADALPRSDHLREPATNMAAALDLRCRGREFRARRAAIYADRRPGPERPAPK